MTRRRILEEIELSKIACVDHPAQEGAVVTILKRAPKQQQVDDPDDDGTIDDWSPKDQSRRRSPKRQPRGWSREDIDEVNKQRKSKHPFEVLTDNLARGHGIPKYMAQSLARHQAPQSYRHYQQQGIAASQRPKPMKKAVIDDATLAWDAAVNTWSENYGLSRCESMQAIRKQAPSLWRRFRSR